jgi:uncharacterized membrane protein
MSSRGHRDVAVVVGACAIVLLLGSVGKTCRGFWHDPMSLLCHSDIRALYGLRGLDRELFPYLHGELIVVPTPHRRWPPFELRPIDGANEYPVLTGVLMWLPSLVSDSPDTYLLASVVLLAPFGLATAWLLGRMTGRRALLWSASPMLLLYAFHNWDLAVAAASVAGFWCWWRGRPMATAACFGVGGALKLYPLLFLLPLVLERIDAGDPRGAVRAGTAGVGIFALVNLPFLLLSPSGWRVSYRFLSDRYPNHDSLWGVLGQIFDMQEATITMLSTLAVLVVLAAVTWGTLGGRRRAARPAPPGGGLGPHPYAASAPARLSRAVSPLAPCSLRWFPPLPKALPQ